MPAHKKARGWIRASAKTCSASILPASPPERRYPLTEPADSHALLQWDLRHAGGLHRLAQHLHTPADELQWHRWRLQILSPANPQQGGRGHG